MRKEKRMTNIKKILVAIDFSENASKIVDSAFFFANKLGAELSIVHVVEGLDKYSGFVIPHISLGNLEQDLLKGAELKMEDFIDEHLAGKKTPVPYKYKVLVGDVGDELKKYAAQENCDLLIIGTHGHKGLEKTLFGSIAEEVLKSAPCPVLTVNPFKLK